MIRIRSGYLAAIPPSSWWAKWLCKIIKAKSFHWFIFVKSDRFGWIISESIGKGTALTRFHYPNAYIYKIKGLEVKPDQIIQFHSFYGGWRYDWDVAFKSALWWLLKHYFGILIPRHRDKSVNCQEWVNWFAENFDYKIVEDWEYPVSKNLEDSKYLEFVGEITL